MGGLGVLGGLVGLASFGGLDGLGKLKVPTATRTLLHTHLLTMPQAARKNLHSKKFGIPEF